MLKVLVIPIHNVIRQQDTTRIGIDLVQGVLTGSILADLYETHVLIPNGIRTEQIRHWRSDLIPIWFDITRDLSSGCGATKEFTQRLLPLLSDYDAIFNYSADMTLWLTSFPECPPVVTTIDNPSSVKEWSRNPIAQWEFTHAFEILQTGAACVGKLLFHNPDDFNLVKRNLIRILSYESMKKAKSNMVFAWNPIVPIAPLRKHVSPENEEFELLIAGGFGKGREGLPKQAETTVKAVQMLRKMGMKVKLTICSSTPISDWATGLISGHGYITFYHRPDNYKELFDRAHVGIALREISDGSRFTLSEMMMNGKPIIWLNNRYVEGWTDIKLMPYCVSGHDVLRVVYAIRKCIRYYSNAAELAYKQGAIACNRHHRDTWKIAMKEVFEEVTG